jgi:hypothetical protein
LFRPLVRLFVFSGGDYSSLFHVAKDVLSRLRGIAFTDSVHSIDEDESKPVADFLRAHAINYVTSDKPLGTVIRRTGLFAAKGSRSFLLVLAVC